VPEQLIIQKLTGFGLATVMARKDIDFAQLGAALKMPVPGSCCWTRGGNLTLIGTGPGVWMALAEDPAPEWIDGLSECLAGIASVSDQSGGYVILRISGRSARSLLQRGAFVDLDPSAFGPGSAATSVIAHIGVTVWQVDDTPAFNVALFRSLAKSFQDWIDATAPALNF
jgi:methylglutamate dehydrogenase subunit D